jgi:GT2 family glycosyltransferase
MTQLSEQPALTVCIATYNRRHDLTQCLKSLALLSNIPFELIVFDDASDEPITASEVTNIISFAQRVEVIRPQENKGYIYARNQMARRAKTPYILSLDDDARLFDSDGVAQALKILENDSKIGAVALSQAQEDGSLLPDFMQPTPVVYNCYAQSFTGYGHILRRDLFVKLGGYKELFQAFAEEAEYCKRMLNLGFYVIYLPEAKVIHYHSPIGRNELKRLRYGCRNKCFDAMYNEPLIMLFSSIFYRIINYIRWRKVPCEYHKFSDKGGVRWLLKELYINLPKIWRERKPLKWSTYSQWFQIRKKWPAYQVNNF